MSLNYAHIQDSHWRGILLPVLSHTKTLAGIFYPIQDVCCPRAKMRPHTSQGFSPQLLFFLGVSNIPAKNNKPFQ